MGAQHDDDASSIDAALHTPVAGSVRSTRPAPPASPVSAHAIERTCSYPVSTRKFGARP
ncbi:MAG: hypothetical protein HYR51_01845 [Candidatus Rokubacteria bacterium]|nr:hypothetical protein [Candidatus Rokubacteria bacterium]